MSAEHAPESRLSSTCIVGGGPAAIATILACVREGQRGIVALLGERGLTVVEKGDRIGSGGLGRYAQTAGKVQTFTTADLVGFLPSSGALGDLRQMPGMARILDREFVTFREMTAILNDLGDRIRRLLDNTGGSFHGNCEVTGIQQVGHALRLETEDHADPRAEAVVLSVGGEQRIPEALLPYTDKVVRCQDVLPSPAAVRRLALLAATQRSDHPVVIVGGSGSTFTLLRTLMNFARDAAIRLGPGSITVLHKGKIHLYFPTREDAQSAAYPYEERHVVRDEVYPYSGLLADTKQLYEEIVRDAKHPVKLVELGEDVLETDDHLRNAEVIVASTGFRARAIPVYDSTGRKIGPLLTPRRRHVAVTDRLEVLSDAATAIPGIFANGLGHAKLRNDIPVDGFVEYGQSAQGMVDGLEAHRTRLKNGD